MARVAAVVLALAACLWVSGAEARPHRVACAPLPGVEKTWADPHTRFVLFGEIHGTGEIAGVVADAACLAARERPVIVALELDHARQDQVDAFLDSAGDEAALTRLAFGGEWTGISDGRTSQAMLALLQRLRVLRQAGAPIGVALIDVSPDAYGPGRDGFMAARMEALDKAHPDALIVGLAGNYHTTRHHRLRDGKLWVSMALMLGRERTVSLDVEALRGRAWFCSSDGCGDHDVASDEPPGARGVRRVDPRESVEFDFLFSPGRDLTASAPVGFVPDKP